MAVVSIVIPVYNVEQYLEECLESILTQSYRDLEVICVNDGSTDGSAEILETFRCRDSRVIVITTENQGVSIARNTGLEVATGKYIYFVDSDDYLVPDAIESMVSAAEEYSLDILCVGVDIFSEDSVLFDYTSSESNYFRIKNEYPLISKGKTLMAEMHRNGDYRATPYVVFIRHEYLNENKILFFPNIIHEDVLFIYQTMINAVRAGVLNQTVYMRRIRPNSIVTSQKAFKNFYSLLVSYIEMQKYVLGNASYHDTEGTMLPIIELLDNVTNHYLELSEEDRKQIDQLPYEMRLHFNLAIKHVEQLLIERNAFNNVLNQREKDVAALEAALNQREKDVATLENALNQRAAEVAALESKLKAIEETWLYKAASRIIKG